MQQGVTSTMKRILLGLTASLLLSGAALAAGPSITWVDTSLGKVMADDKGMVLYTFDKDTKGAADSACKDKCIVAWPPLVAADGAMAEGDWTIVNVTDKDGKAVKMWAYEGWPLYYYVKDTKAGDVTGDNVGNVWHVIKEAM
jgi:predicted lipoprotein with Yx(FWY)xxD motif